MLILIASLNVDTEQYIFDEQYLYVLYNIVSK